MTTVAKHKTKAHAIKRPTKAKTVKAVSSSADVEVRLSDRDRDTLLAALSSSQPNHSLTVAAEKYKKQCA